MAIKENDFVEIDFTGRIKENNQVFDTTIRKVAVENGLDPKAKYEHAIVCIGRGYIFPKIEEKIKGSEAGKEFKIDLNPEEAFGKKDAKLIQTMPTSVFRKENIKPMVGLNITVNDRLGVIRTVNGGRCMIDFNHPLSGKDLVYDVKILKIIEDKKEKVSHIIKTELRLESFEIEEKDNEMTVKFDEKISKLLTEEMRKVLSDKIKEITGITVIIK